MADQKFPPELMNRVDRQDAARRRQISNQVDSINRIMKGSTYDDEMQILHDRLASAEAALHQIEAMIGPAALGRSTTRIFDRIQVEINSHFTKEA